MQFLFGFFLGLLSCVLASPPVTCPDVIRYNGYSKDLALLSDSVSWNDPYGSVGGVCGSYHPLFTAEGWYQTRMRIYQNEQHPNVVIISFRPTQQTNEGGQIHVNRHLVPCAFFSECQGLVNDRFQQAFISMIRQLPAQFAEEYFVNKDVLITGHSLGGSFAIFMGLYLYHTYDVLPQQVLGLAGPFIGDDTFTNLYQTNFKTMMGERWWQIESVNQYNPGSYDGTVEGYQVDYNPYLSIQYNVICGVPISPLPDSYGMHDLRNYQLFFQGGACEV